LVFEVERIEPFWVRTTGPSISLSRWFHESLTGRIKAEKSGNPTPTLPPTASVRELKAA
jgi:hypothetical protein